MTIPITGGSGGGLAINTLSLIYTLDSKYVTEDGQEWLRTGLLETDVASYPDASRDIGNFDDYSVNFAISEVGAPRSIFLHPDGLYYILDASGYTLKKYDSLGVYQGNDIDLTLDPAVAYAYGVCVGDGFMWVLTGTSLHKFTLAGVYISTLSSIFVTNSGTSSITFYNGHVLRSYASSSSGQIQSINVNTDTYKQEMVMTVPNNYQIQAMTIAYGRLWYIPSITAQMRLYSVPLAPEGSGAVFKGTETEVVNMQPYYASEGICYGLVEDVITGKLCTNSANTDGVNILESAAGVGVGESQPLNDTFHVDYFMRIL